MNTSATIVRLSLAAAMVAVVGAASAEQRYSPGVTDTGIKIGQTMPYSGPLSGYAGLGRAEAAYFAKIDAEGGSMHPVEEVPGFAGTRPRV